ncbi:sugar lactone lactonase YvrE [Nocardia alba]|uniref:Sugar lactone lactonase YvrE n=1 Tax=Nocardia alba TaxID=225051 RepID=A0A4R1FYP3_9NOCA|nr:sugar lactone lactonase YvrE [Nocardia alba]
MIRRGEMTPIRWRPPSAPPRARVKASAPPMPVIHRIELPGTGPEDVVFGADDMIYTGTADGAILRIDPHREQVWPVVSTGGRPLGLHADSDGSLLICDAHRGLLRWDQGGGGLEVLVETVDEQRLGFASNVVRTGDGTIYFTESSQRWFLEQWMGDLFEHSGTGRLIALAPSGQVTVLWEGLHFANGLAVEPGGDALIVAETAAYRLNRFRLRGPRAGEREILIDNLPGFPDNISVGSDGLIWVSLASPRNRLLDALADRPPWIRSLLWRVPDRVKPAPERTVWVLGVDPDSGQIVHDLQRGPEEYSMVTSVAEHDRTLVLGSLHESAVAVTHVPA